jgi:hypothetical protein
MEHILQRSLKLIEEIYDNTMYEKNDFFRIKDIIHSLDSKQIDSKKWLVEHFSPLYRSIKNGNNFTDGNILIIGGWYGLLSYFLRQEFPNKTFNITSIDVDPTCEDFAWRLFYDYDISFETVDATDNLNFSEYSAIISTSCEHIEKDFWIELAAKKNKECWLCLQTNDYFDHPTHINCSNTEEEFESYIPLWYVAKTLKLDLGDFNRFMVIGK